MLRCVMITISILSLFHGFAPETARAHTEQIPIGGDLLKIDNRKEPKKHKFLFKAVKQPDIEPVHNPALNGSKFLIRWTGPDAGRSALVELDASKWKGLGNPAGIKGFKYTDRASARGVKTIIWKPGRSGGMLKILGGGENLEYTRSIPANPATMEVHFNVENEWYCASFGGDVKIAGPDFYLAKKAAAPQACPETLCGNGIQELGEDCDDGNLDEADGCSNTCAVTSGCSGESFDSTYEGIQAKIFDAYSCSESSCHGSNSGRVNLTDGNSYAAIFNQPANQSSLKLIEPGDQDLSFLYRKIAAKTLGGDYATGLPGSPMPPTSSTVAADPLDALRKWIRGGAPEDGVIEGTAELLDACLPEATPLKVVPLDPPAPGVGVQFYAPPWSLPSGSEREVCYTTCYDVSDQVPAENKTPCPDNYGGSSKTCFKWDSSVILQDAQSHHVITTMYTGASDWTDPKWGAWTCHGGDLAGTSCDPDPAQDEVSASLGGGDCGSRSACSSTVVDSVACTGYGPDDYTFSVLGGGSATTTRFGGTQESRQEVTMPDGVHSTLPEQACIVWNSHAFNLTDTDTTMEAYYNFSFAEPTDEDPMVAIFDADTIFAMNVPAFQKQEVCGTFVLPPNSYLFELSSHAHRHLEKFRIWLPPNTSSSSDIPTSTPDYISRIYNDPVIQIFPDPILYPATLNDYNRRVKYCAVYDNGADHIEDVRKHSESVGLVVLLPCAPNERRCIGGPNHGLLCAGDDSNCETAPQASDGVCDACPLRGGVTTHDEMMIMLGNFYIPGS